MSIRVSFADATPEQATDPSKPSLPEPRRAPRYVSFQPIRRPDPYCAEDMKLLESLELSLRLLEFYRNSSTFSLVPHARVSIRYKAPAEPLEFWKDWLSVRIFPSSGVSWKARLASFDAQHRLLDFAPLDAAENEIASDALTRSNACRIDRVAISILGPAIFTREIDLSRARLPSP